MSSVRSLLLLLSAGFVAGAAHAQALNTAKLDEARSAVGEAAAVTRAEARGQVTHAYADGVREDIRKDLQKLVEEPQLETVARQALRALDAKNAARLGALKDHLVALERAHGRAS